MQNNQKIPDGWSVKKLGKCVHILGGYAYDSSECTSAGVKWLKIANVGKGKLEKSEFDYLPIEYKVSTKNYLLKKGDIVMALTRPITDNQLKIAYIDDDEYLLNQRVGKLLFPDDVYADFIYNQLISSKIVCRISSLLIGTDPPNLTGNVLNQINVFIPPLDEQKKITEILGTWDEAIKKLSDLIEQKKLLKKGLMQKLLTGKTCLPGFTQPWKEVKLGEICKLGTALSKSSLIIENGKYYVIDMGAVSSEATLILTKRTDSNEDLLVLNDIVMPKDDIGGGNIIGKTALIKKDNTYVLSDHIFKLKIHEADANFIAYLINLYKYNKYMRRMSCGSAILGLAKKDVEKCLLYIPTDIAEQKAIADILSAADEEIDVFNKKLETLKEQKKGLMQKLLTGKIRVKVN